MRSSMSNSRITRKRRERERSFTDDEFYRWQRRSSVATTARSIWCSGAGKSISGSEREETMVVPGFYMDRERGKGKRKGAAADGLAIDGRQALRVMEK
jgi:hypothetical protein